MMRFCFLQSQPRFAARSSVLDYLASKGLLVRQRPHSLQLPRCMRSGDVIEPRLKVQWFLKAESLANAALAAVERNELRLHPSAFSKVWSHFLSNHKDWCISRQVWWGHRVPAFWASTRSDSSFGSEEELAERCSVFVAAADQQEAAQKASLALGKEPQIFGKMFLDGREIDFLFQLVNLKGKVGDLRKR